MTQLARVIYLRQNVETIIMAIFEYSEFDGSQQFQPLSAESAFDKLAEYLLEYGDYVLRQLERLPPDDAGHRQDAHQGRLPGKGRGGRPDHRAARASAASRRRRSTSCSRSPDKDRLGKHETDFKGAGEVRPRRQKPYEYGDPVANLNLHETLKNAWLRPTAGVRANRSLTKRIDVSEDDFVVYETEYQTSCATVVLLDMSGSMARYGKYYHAKKVALALQGLVRGRYPGTRSRSSASTPTPRR